MIFKMASILKKLMPYVSKNIFWQVKYYVQIIVLYAESEAKN